MSCVSILQGPSNLCTSKTIFRELSPEAKAAILDRHNQLRRRAASRQEDGGDNGPQRAKTLVLSVCAMLCGTPAVVLRVLARRAHPHCKTDGDQPG